MFLCVKVLDCLCMFFLLAGMVIYRTCSLVEFSTVSNYAHDIQNVLV
jgi:hypothetical protein